MSSNKILNFLAYPAVAALAVVVFLGVEIIPNVQEPLKKPVKDFSALAFDLNELLIKGLGNKAYTGSASDVVNLGIINNCVLKKQIYATEFLGRSKSYIRNKDQAIACFKQEAETYYLSKNMVNEMLIDNGAFKRTLEDGKWKAPYDTSKVDNFMKYSTFVKLAHQKKQMKLSKKQVEELVLKETAKG
ncbi:hypothetical protein ACQWTT_001072 [Acinetobacter baumannii]